MGIAIGFLIPPILVPNVDDVQELAHHIKIMFYISAGVATIIFILVIIGKSSIEDPVKARQLGKTFPAFLLSNAINVNFNGHVGNYNKVFSLSLLYNTNVGFNPRCSSGNTAPLPNAAVIESCIWWMCSDTMWNTSRVSNYVTVVGTWTSHSNSVKILEVHDSQGLTA